MKKYFLTGLVTLLPLTVTAYVVVFIVGILTRPFVGLVTEVLYGLPLPFWLHTETMIRVVAQIMILIFLFLFILFLGSMARWFFIRSVLKLSDAIMHKIPLINKVYKTTKEIIRILFNPNKQAFKQVVMLHFPDQDSYCLGLISRESPELCVGKDCADMVSVFLPTTPNPMTGFMTISPKKDLIYLDMTSEEAIKYIVSCGAVQPKEHKDE